MRLTSPLHPVIYEPILRRGLEEDLGRVGDRTTDSTIPRDLSARGRLVARAAGRVAGLEMATAVFAMLDPATRIDSRIEDGADVQAGAELATVAGPARAILTGERLALNVVGRLCGIATATRDVVEAVRASSARVVCTRKTTPGLRALEKYAVRVGGGANHRFGLDDGVLVKDNHLALIGSVREAVARVRHAVGHMVKVEIEVEDLDQVREALEAGVDALLLDNMSLALLGEAVALADGRVLTEASGGITPQTAAEVAASGVDLLSVGWITHSAPVLDVALDVSPL